MSRLTIAQTDRLNIRCLCNSDLSELAAMLSDPEVMTFSVNAVMTRDATQDFLDWYLQLPAALTEPSCFNAHEISLKDLSRCTRN
jgi:RimJ/RimL family protein N-acetyltransferase